MALNILIGKLGKSTRFDVNKHGFVNGDEEAPNMYIMLAKRYPEHNFYFCGVSDITKYRALTLKELGYDPLPFNIIDMYSDYKPVPDELKADWLYNKATSLGVHFDCGIIYQGPVGCVNVSGKGIRRLDDKGDAKMLLMNSNYAGQSIHLLNQLNTPYMLLCGDSRYVPSICRDAYNIERIVLTQTNLNGRVKRIKSYAESTQNDCVFHDVNYVYSRIETIFMLTETKVDWRNIQKTNKFVIGLNGGLTRDKFISDWLLNTGIDLTDIKVFGKWSEEFTSKFPDLFEEKSIKSVEDVFFNSRYTVIPPPHDGMKTFVTQKFWKMIHYGIIPFFHPNYDTLKLLDVPEFLRIKTPSEMWERIKFLDNNPLEYEFIKNRLWKMLKDDYYNGNFLNDVISKSAQKYLGVQL